MSVISDFTEQALQNTGIQIGSFKLNPLLQRYVKSHTDGVYLFDISKQLKRIDSIGHWLSMINPANIYLTTKKEEAETAVTKFASILGAKAAPKRHLPGTFHNYDASYFVDAEAVILSSPGFIDEKGRQYGDYVAHQEAIESKIPIVSLCTTDEPIFDVDMVIPCNNRGHKSLATVYYLLLRSTLYHMSELDRHVFSIEDFEQKIVKPINQKSDSSVETVT